MSDKPLTKNELHGISNKLDRIVDILSANAFCFTEVVKSLQKLCKTQDHLVELYEKKNNLPADDEKVSQ